MDGMTDRHGPKTVLSSIHVVEYLLFSMFPLILTFYINPIFGFLGPKWINFWLKVKENNMLRKGLK